MSQNNHPYYNYNQHTPGPSQPQWQAPQRQGWGDPRPGLTSPATNSPSVPFPPSQGFAQPLPPPPPPPPGGFSVPTYQDTSSWGVKYNQNPQFGAQQDNTLRPALPPRPASGLGQQPQPSWPGASSQQKPPTPPPRPAEYATPQPPTQNHYFPHEQYSNRPTSHQYDPGNQWHSSQPSNASTNSWQNNQPRIEEPVSPIDHHSGWQSSGPLGASALGSGGPSDWEHFSGDHPTYDSASPTQHPYQPAQQQSYQTPTGPSPAPPSQQQQYHGRQQSLGHAVTPEQTPAQPVHPSPGKIPFASTSPPPQPQTSSISQQPPYPSVAPNAYQQSPSRHSIAVPYGDTAAAQPASYRPRVGSESSANSSPGPGSRPGTIDSVIDAWSAPAPGTRVDPLKPASRPTSTIPDKFRQSRDIASTQTQTDFPPIVKSETKVVTKIETREVDPYEDLKDEYRTSLNRYATMLRQEKGATSEQEKMRIVAEFVNREVKLRSVMFNADPAELVRSSELADLRHAAQALKHAEANIVPPNELAELRRAAQQLKEVQANVVPPAELAELRRASQRLKELEPQIVPPNELAELRRAAQQLKEIESRGGQSAPSLAAQAVPRATSPANKRPSVQTDMAGPQHSRDDSFVMVDANGDDADYSPGGRPRVSMVNRIPPQQRPITPSIQTGPPRNSTPAQPRAPQPPSPGANAPMVLDDYVMPDNPQARPDRSFNATPAHVPRPSSAAPPPPGAKPTQSTVPIPFQPARPAYTPFRYNEGQNVTQPVVNQSNPANMAYTKLRHEQATESGRILSQEPPLLTVTAPDRSQSATPSRARQQQEEAFIGLLRQQSKATKKPLRAGSPDAPAPLRAGTPMMQRRPSLPPVTKSVEALRQSLPDNVSSLSFSSQIHPKLAPVTQSVTNMADDFGFIHATVVAWDRENRKLRHKLDTDRAARESENQAHIDSLFHDNQIGYADIAGLEEDFKLEEATKKYEEDQDELDSFTRNVYEKVTQRLESEVAELETLRIRTMDVLDLETESGSHRIQTALRNPGNALERAPLGETMMKMMQIFNKIEIRQQKIAEANFERERRRKRLELTVLYTNGDKAGVQQLEKDFDKAQSMQVLSGARKRDERANKLMDSFDRAGVRGLAENQEWVDEMSMKATLVRDLVRNHSNNGPQGKDREDLLYGPRGVRESLELLQDAVNIVLADSRDIIQISSQADKMLNEADFAMFLAEAKIANADEKEFEKLKGEKAKEDQKLRDEYDGRINGVQRGPEEILGIVKDVRDSIGNDGGHQERLNSALEAAKRRNASISGQDPGMGTGTGMGTGLSGTA